MADRIRLRRRSTLRAFPHLTMAANNSVRVLCAFLLFAFCGDAGGDETRVAETLKTTKLINYYPARQAQARMWTEWDPSQAEKDFRAIRAMNANAVRVAVYTDAFGFPEPKPEMLRRLHEFIRLADGHSLKVKLALFGFFDDWQDIEGSSRWARAILKDLKDDRRIAFLDIYNELKLEQPGAITWAAKLLPIVRSAAGSIPITASVSGSAGVPGLVALKGGLDAAGTGAPLVDFYEFHYYGKASLARRAFEEARAAVAPTPLYVGEFGYSTQPRSRQRPPSYSDAWWEAYQGHYFRTIFQAARDVKLAAPAPWIFSDYVEGAFRPGKTASDPAEYAMGLQRIDGTLKPAGVATARYFDTGEVDLSFNNGFEATDGAGLPLQWLIWQPELATFGRDTSVARSGSASARISMSRRNPAAVPAFTTSPIKTIAPGNEYRAAVWSRGEKMTGHARLALAWFDAKGTYLSSSTSPELRAGTTDWKLLQVSALAPEEAAYVEIHLGSSGNEGTVWFDDASFEWAGQAASGTP